MVQGRNPETRSFLLTWNPTLRGSWRRFEGDLKRFERKGVLKLTWSCGSRRNLPVGSRVYLMRLGGSDSNLKGLIARGVATSEPFEGDHWSAERPTGTALYVDVTLDELSATPLLPLDALELLAPDFDWTPQGSGVEIPREVAGAVALAWGASDAAGRLPEELSSEEALVEGAARRVLVNAWERNPRARAACLRHHGTRCAGCGLDLESVYGPIAKGFVHVHHVVPISRVGRRYVVDPVNDLVPVCPSCHGVIHLSKPPLSLEGLRASLAKQKVRTGDGSVREAGAIKGKR